MQGVHKGVLSQKVSKRYVLKTYLMVPGAGIEPARPWEARDFKSLVSTNFTTRAGGGLDQIAVRILTLTEIFSSTFHRFYRYFYNQAGEHSWA